MKTVAIFFGGRSTEHDVSIVTAIASIIKPLELTKEYQIEPVYIARDGRWYWDQKLQDIKLFSEGRIDDYLERQRPAGIVFDGGLTLVKAGGIAGRSQTQKIDIAFPSMHGTYGEDGSLMGLLDMSGIPYVGCGLASAALAMDKVLAKQIISASGLATCKFIYFSRRQIENDQQNSLKAIEKHLKYPLFVKPAHLGSSIGISRAANQTELLNALDLAAHYDDKILVEEEVVNLIEVTLPIMGNDDPKPALLERPMIKPEDFFDFDSKYMHGGKKGKGTKGSQGYSELPAKLPKDLYQKAEKLGVEVYKALNCSGTARVDMLIDNKTGTVYFNEVNPLPGSLYAHNWAKAGVSNVELVTKLIGYAEERWQSEQQLITSFDTNYLQQF